MALIGALNAGISGLRAQETRISVIGDNIANVDTVGFKQARVNFETMLSQTISFGTAPDGTLGGIDPPQIGKGVQVGIFDNGQQRTLAQQFTELIVGQRAFQANARTITTSDAMLQELISMVR